MRAGRLHDIIQALLLLMAIVFFIYGLMSSSSIGSGLEFLSLSGIMLVVFFAVSIAWGIHSLMKYRMD